MIMKYSSFNESFLSDLKIKGLCYKYGIKNYTINSDGTIDVDGDVNLSNYRNRPMGGLPCSKLKKLPLKFRKVNGFFNCSGNELISLVGSPISVGDFNCSYNKLNSL